MKLYFTIFYTLFSTTLCYAFQDLASAYFIRNYNDENGLPQNGIKQIISDSLGFVWLATEGGLVRFDGQKFKVYTKSKIGFKSDRFVNFSNNTPDGSLYAIAEFDKTIRIKNGIAFRDSLSNICFMDIANLAPIKRAGISIPSHQEMFFAVPKEYKIFCAAKGRYYIYNKEQITLIDSGKIQFTAPFKGKMSTDLPQLEWSHQLRSGVVGKEDHLSHFFIVGGQLFYQINDLGNNFLAISPTKNGKFKNIILQGDITKNPAFDRKNDDVRIIWNAVNHQSFAYLNEHFYIITSNGSMLTTRLLLKGLDFDKNYIRTAYYQELDGSIFLGSQAQGLFALTPKSFATMTVPGEDSDNIFYAQAPYGPSSIITPRGFVLDPHKDAVEIMELNDDNLTSKRTALRDRNLNFWISRDHSIYKYSADGKHIIKSWLLAEQTLSLYEGLDGGIWSGSSSGTISYLDNQSKLPPVVEKIINIPRSEITWFLQTTPEQLWIGTTNGLYAFNPHSRLLTNTKGLEDVNIRCVYNSGPDQLWITTYGSGIFLLENGKLTKLPKDRNQYLNYAHCIIEDRVGNFWITANKGLFQVQKKDLQDFSHHYKDDVFYLHYDKSNGFQTNEFNGGCQPCGLKIGAGLISFPSLSGFVWFNPALVKSPTLDHHFILEDFNVDGKGIPMQDTITLPYNFSLFKLAVTTPYFGNGSNLHFTYNIHPAGKKEGKWLFLDKNQLISIINLPSDNYILTVKKLTGSGNQNVQRNIYIRVQTPWFLHWAFFLLVTGILIGVIGLVVRWRTGYLLRQNQLLGQKVEDRTMELSAALDGLMKSERDLNRQLQVQSIINGAISHDIRSPLKYLAANIKKMQQQVESEFPTFPYLHIGKLIYQSTDQVLVMTEDLLRFIRLIKEDKEILIESISARQILEAKSALFIEMAKENQTVIEVIAKDDILVNSNRQMLEIIIHNLLDNAVKSTFQDSIILAAEQVGTYVSISVTDTGGGMPQDIADWFNFSRSDTGFTGNSLAESGFGLVVVKEIAAMLSIKINLQTTETGTKVELLLH